MWPTWHCTSTTFDTGNVPRHRFARPSLPTHMQLPSEWALPPAAVGVTRIARGAGTRCGGFTARNGATSNKSAPDSCAGGEAAAAVRAVYFKGAVLGTRPGLPLSIVGGAGRGGAGRARMTHAATALHSWQAGRGYTRASNAYNSRFEGCSCISSACRVGEAFPACAAGADDHSRVRAAGGDRH